MDGGCTCARDHAQRAQPQLEMGEAVNDRRQLAWRLRRAALAPRRVLPVLGGVDHRRAPQATPDAGRRASLQQPLSVHVLDQQQYRFALRTDPAWPRRRKLIDLIGQVCRAVSGDRALPAMWAPRGTQLTAEVHHGLGVIG